MDVEIIQTKDGSHTLYSKQFDEIYHSRNGALAESQHIFIHNGLEACHSSVINVFELGFGTGLNALLSWEYAESKNIRINYHSVELYPVSEELIGQINYPELIGHKEKFQQLHAANWNDTVTLSENFTLHKINGSVLDMQFPVSTINVIFFDAFSPEKQSELWTVDVFSKCMIFLLRMGYWLLIAPNLMSAETCSKQVLKFKSYKALMAKGIW